MNPNVERTMQAMKAWVAQDLDEYRTLYHPDAVLHGFAPVVLDSIADGDRVAMRFLVTGTHQGEFQGIPATGRSMAVQGMTILHFRDGKIAERWNQFDQMGLMQQLGVMGG